MPLKIIRQDITKIECDAIVNPTNKDFIPGGGTDLAVHEAAGAELFEYCKKLEKCAVGEARITPAFNLPCKYVIHTVGPGRLFVGNHRKMLENCYRNSLALALQAGCESVALPLISSGSNGAPKGYVMKTAMNVITDFLYHHEMTVYLVVFDKMSYNISKTLFSDVKSYIDDNYRNEALFAASLGRHVDRSGGFAEKRMRAALDYDEAVDEQKEEPVFCRQSVDMNYAQAAYQSSVSLDEMLDNMDKGFAEMLFSFIDQKGLTDVECYKKSNVDKKTFSKIKCNKDYKPSKVTAVSFAVGLRLSLAEANRLLGTVGMCLSHSQKFDVIIEYFLKTGNYKDIFEVNEVLYKFDQTLLGV